VDFIRQDTQFKCCFCLHVRTGTIILGVLHILLQLIVVSALLMAALKQDIVTFNKSPFNPVGFTNCQHTAPPSDMLFMMMHIVPGFTIFHKAHSEGQAELKHVVKKDDEVVFKPRSSFAPDCNDRGRHANPYFSLCLALISLAFGYLLVHGVISRQPAHLLPFFCLQVFDFVVAIICMLGYISSASDFGNWLKAKDSSNPHTGRINPTSFALLMVSTSCLILAFKAYCIGMVWDCHRYLLLVTNRRDFIPRLPFFLGGMFRRPHPPNVAGDAGREDLAVEEAADPTSFFVGGVPLNNLPDDSALPKYEKALGTPANAYAPPPYFAKVSKVTTEPTKEKSSSVPSE